MIAGWLLISVKIMHFSPTTPFQTTENHGARYTRRIAHILNIPDYGETTINEHSKNNTASTKLSAIFNKTHNKDYR